MVGIRLRNHQTESITMSIHNAVESILGGISISAAKDIAAKAAHKLLDEVCENIGEAGGKLLAHEATELKLTLTPEQADALAKAVVEHIRSKI